MPHHTTPPHPDTNRATHDAARRHRASTPPQYLPLMVIVLLLMTAWAAPRLNADALWYDEFWSLYNAGWATYDGPPRDVPLSPRAVWHQVADVDPIHPIGYALALNVWGRMLGPSVFAMRLFSLYAGLLSVATTARVAHEWTGPRAAPIAAVLLASSAFYAHYLHEMRMYTLLLWLVVLALWSYGRLLRRISGPFGLIFLVSVAGLVYTQYFSVLLLTGLAGYHLFAERKTRRWWIITALVMAAALLYIPWMPTVWALFTSVQGGTARDGAFTTARILADSLAVYSNVNLTTTDGAWALSALVGAWSAVSVWRGKRLIFIVLGVTYALLLLVNAQTGMFIHIRYVLIVLPLVVMAFAGGLSRLAQGWAVLFVMFWLLLGWTNYAVYEDDYNRDDQWTLDWPAIVAELAALDDGETAFIVAAGNRAWWDYEQIRAYYATGRVVATTHITPLRGGPLPDSDYGAELAPLLADLSAFYMVTDTTQGAARRAAFGQFAELEAFVACDTRTTDKGLRVVRYAHDCADITE